MRHRTALALLTAFALMIALPAVPVQAAVDVGDTPTIEFKATDGRQVNAESLRGKLVIVDFWATWCPPCVAAMPHMKELYEKYHSQGVEVIGISLDRDRGALDEFVEDREIPWPQHFGKQAFAMAQQWGVRGIPHVFILSPEGEVLWHGHPARMHDPFQKALKEHPPTAGEADNAEAE